MGEAGLTFIGPPPEAMVMMGDKAAARRAAQEVGAPIVPGTPDPVSAEEAIRAGTDIGFPLVVKAAHGGGGKGMRLVERVDDLAEAVEWAETEAREYAATLTGPPGWPTEYTGLAQAYLLFDAPGHGAEVFSLLRGSDLDPEEYLDRYFDTGTERQRPVGTDPR